jgi:hypothetical protein
LYSFPEQRPEPPDGRLAIVVEKVLERNPPQAVRFESTDLRVRERPGKRAFVLVGWRRFVVRLPAAKYVGPGARSLASV